MNALAKNVRIRNASPAVAAELRQAAQAAQDHDYAAEDAATWRAGDIEDAERAGQDRRVYNVPAYKVAELNDRFARIARKAAKLGLPAPTFEVVGYHSEPEEVVVDQVLRRTGRLIKTAEVIVTGEAPRLAGWTFVASLDHADAGNVVRSISGDDVPELYRTTPPNCDHCRINVRRKQTFLVRSDAGELKQVGRNCLQDFCGGTSPEAIVSRATWTIELREMLGEFEHMPRVAFEYETATVLAWTAATVRVLGYVSNSEAEERMLTSTSRTVQATMSAAARGVATSLKYEIEDQDQALALAARNWMRSKRGEPGLSDYMSNCALLADADDCEPRHFGFVCSIIQSYNREIEREVAKAREAATPSLDEHFGDPGAKGRQEYVLTVMRYFPRASEGYGYGAGETVTHIFSFVDQDGRAATWYGSNDAYRSDTITLKGKSKKTPPREFGPCEAFEVGKTYRVLAKIKRHGDYRGVKTTYLSMVTQLEEVQPDRKGGV